MIRTVKTSLSYGLVAASLAACGGTDRENVPGAPVQAMRAAAGASAAAAVVIAGYRDAYTLSVSGGSATIASKSDPADVVRAASPLLVQFFDRHVSFDTAGTPGQLYRLYQAAFNRKPDATGLGFWIHAAQGGTTLAEVARGFIASDEFTQLYGRDLPAGQFVTLVYRNVLHREPEADGLAWWMAQLAAGATREDVLLGFAESDENQAAVLPAIVAGFEFAPYVPGGPILPQRTSYANAKGIDRAPLRLPAAVQYADAHALADFRQDGTQSLFAARLTYTPALPASAATPAQFAFFTRDANGNWAEQPGMIDSPAGCLHPRKAVVADFNADGKPDILVACHGYDGAPFAGERMWLVASTAGGQYVSRPLGDFVGFFHAATAADIDGDGRIDIIATDTNTGDGVRLFLNRGAAGFAEAKGRFPAAVKNRYYYAVEVTDADGDGKLDLLVGGNEALNDTVPLLIRGDGSGSFAKSEVVALPAVPAHNSTLDFVATNGAVYVNRTSGDPATFYDTKAIQKFDLRTRTATLPFVETGNGWFAWLIPFAGGVASDNLDRPASAQ